MKRYSLPLAASLVATLAFTGCKCDDCVKREEFVALQNQVVAIRDDVNTTAALLYASDTTGNPSCPPRCEALRDTIQVFLRRMALPH